MAVRPDECTRLSELEAQLFQDHEARIDDALRAFYYPGERVHVDLTGVGERVRRRLVNLYERHGWVVEYLSSQLDGDTLTFSEPVPVVSGYDSVDVSPWTPDRDPVWLEVPAVLEWLQSSDVLRSEKLKRYVDCARAGVGTVRWQAIPHVADDGLYATDGRGNFVHDDGTVELASERPQRS